MALFRRALALIEEIADVEDSSETAPGRGGAAATALRSFLAGLARNFRALFHMHIHVRAKGRSMGSLTRGAMFSILGATHHG
jgi:hypothetical protein